MNKNILLALGLMLHISSCSKKHLPEENTTTTNAEKKIRVMTVPHVITVSDKAAKKSVDGRLYYDVDGHRYWRNYNDGKYYLFNKAMYNDPAFKPH